MPVRMEVEVPEGWDIYRFRFEARVNLSLATLMPFFFFLKFSSILSPLNEMNLFTLEQRWIIFEIYFQNKDNWVEIHEVHCHLGG